MLDIVMPSCVAAMNGSGSETARSYRPRAPVPLGDQLIDPRLADRHDREFRRDEEPVGEDEREHGSEPPQVLAEREFHYAFCC
jgi:hypothetical protein